MHLPPGRGLPATISKPRDHSDADNQRRALRAWQRASQSVPKLTGAGISASSAITDRDLAPRTIRVREIYERIAPSDVLLDTTPTPQRPLPGNVKRRFGRD